MEECVNSEYQNDSSKSPKTWATQKENSNHSQEIKSEAAGEVSRPRKKIARENRSIGWTEPGKAAASVRTDKDKLSKEEDKRVRKLSVLNSKLVTGRRSVQNNTKTLHRNVPDRIGKYINSNVRREAKLSGRESTAKLLNNCSTESVADSDKQSDMSRVCSGTKSIATAGNECPNEKESGTLGNRIGSESGTENIFKKNFGDCLGSTSVVNDASSRGASNLEAGDEAAAAASVDPGKVEKCLENVESSVKDDARMIENERTPVKDEHFRPPPPDTPVKPKDHDNYYSHNKIRHVCGYCHKVFKSNGKLNSHVYSHTGERPFDCNNCGKAFSSKFKLVRHLLIHSEIRKFVCQICDRTFLRNDHLKNHYKIHDPQKKMYKCPKEDCDKEYSSLMSHKKHMAYHSVEDGDLKCLICGVKFETKEEVLFHLKSHSGSRLFKTQSDKKFKCEFCGRLFLTRKDVTRHLVVHTGERDFLCQFCPQRFGRKDHLVRHIKKSHLTDEMALKREMIEKNLTLPKRTPPPATSTCRSESEKQDEEKEKRQQQQEQEQEQRRISTQVKQQEEAQQDEREKQKEQQLKPPQPKQRQQPSPPKLQQLPPPQKQQPSAPKQHLQPPPQKQQKQPTPPKNQQQPPPPKQSKQKQPQEEDEEAEEEEDDEAGDEKTHIVITVKSPMQKKKSKPDSNAKSKSFRKDPSVPKKKQVPLSKNKNSTTQIFLQNIPNILIIPNNSIILLRNQGSSSKAKKTDGDEGRTGGTTEENADAAESLPTYDNRDRFQYPEDITSKSVPVAGDSASLMDTDPAVNYDCNMFQQQHFPNSFPFGVDNLGNFQSDVTTFGHQSEDIGFDLVTASELLKKADAMTDPQEMTAPESPSQSDLHRKVGVVKPMTKNIQGLMAKDLFEEGSESLSLSESILNDFKIDDSIILDNDGGMLNNLFGQSGVEATGNELLRSLLMNDTPIVAPLPGFNQIFNHGSN